VLVYHRIVDRPARTLDAAVAVDEFRAQLDHLVRAYTVVDAATIVDAVTARRRGARFPVALTFDDDVSSHARVVAPLLAERGLHATFFLTRASSSFWWDDLERIVARDGAPPALPDLGGAQDARAAAAAVERLSPDERAAVAAKLRDLAPPGADPGMTNAEVAALESAGHRIGFHTHSHDPLATVPDERLAQVVADDAGATSFAYPHGRAGPREIEAVRSAGYRTAFTGAGGVVRPETDPLAIPRVQAATTAAGLRMQLARLVASA
jgi:peptidoglycan/xylan/chitin deacetylase (PgdA/CDA1 family)